MVFTARGAARNTNLQHRRSLALRYLHQACDSPDNWFALQTPVFVQERDRKVIVPLVLFMLRPVSATFKQLQS